MNGFVETSAAREIEDAVRKAISWEYPCLITGDPGTGKTTALKHFALKYDALYVEIDEGTNNPGGLCKMLVDRLLGFRQGRTIYDDINQLVSRDFRRGLSREDRPKPLFVDEQQTFQATALRELLRICERCDIPLVLAGNRERLAKHKKSDLVALDQIKSRIGWRVHIGAPTPADCTLIATAYNVEGLEAYHAIAAFGRKTNLRELVRLLKEAKSMASGAGISLRHIETAALAIFGGRDALRLLLPDQAA